MFCKFLAGKEPCFFSTLRYFSTATHEGPLKGIKVLDLTRIIAGPTCTLLLADFGADIYKIENPSIGDDCRRWPPIFKDGQSSSTYISLNRNKKSIAVNFKTEEGQELLHDMAKKCDVLVENYVPGTLKKYNMDYDTLRKIAPQLIYCSITGFGSEGPYAKKLGVDLIASSMTGHLHITGTEDGQPCRSGISSIDIMTGLRASSAILAALYEKKSTGLGRKIETDLFSTAVVSLKNYAVSYLNLKTDVEKMGTGHNFVVPYKSFKSKDGYFTAGAINDGQFVLFTELIGKPELSKDERFKTAPNRSKNRKELMSHLENVFITKTTKEWCQIFENSPLPNAPLNNLAQNVTTTPPTLRLKCRKPKSEKSVKWNEGTVDNEHMNKKKSKCCCIYKKPKQRFDESSDSESDECENCFGHVEVKKTKKLAKTSCCEQSSATTSNEVLEHAQQINPSGMTTVSS